MSVHKTVCLVIALSASAHAAFAADENTSDLKSFHDTAEKMYAYQKQKTAEISPAVKEKIEKFHQAVVKNDKPTVANSMCFPAHLNYNGESKQADNKKDFLASYDKVFTKEFRDIVSKQDWSPWWHPHGLMIIDGIIWAHEDGCIISVCSSPQCKVLATNYKPKM